MVSKVSLFCLTLKAPIKKIAADVILMFYFYLAKKIRLDFSCESSAAVMIGALRINHAKG